MIMIGGSMNKLKLKEDIILVIIISFIGFCFENLWMLFRYSIIDNRNMFLPFLLGYGLFVVAIYYIIGVPDKLFNKYKLNSPIKYIIYMFLCFLFVSIGEILLGTFVEWKGNFYYWNYTSIPLHFTKYTSVPTSLGFASVITLFMSLVFNTLQKKVRKKIKKIPLFIIMIIFILLLFDLNISFKRMITNKGHNRIWSINIKK